MPMLKGRHTHGTQSAEEGFMGVSAEEITTHDSLFHACKLDSENAAGTQRTHRRQHRWSRTDSA